MDEPDLHGRPTCREPGVMPVMPVMRYGRHHAHYYVNL